MFKRFASLIFFISIDGGEKEGEEGIDYGKFYLNRYAS
jgi:hypothetical protein